MRNESVSSTHLVDDIQSRVQLRSAVSLNFRIAAQDRSDPCWQAGALPLSIGIRISTERGVAIEQHNVHEAAI